MLQPAKQKHRKQFRGKMRGVAMTNNKLAYGNLGLKSVERGWVNAREIEAARRAIIGHVKRKGKVWIKIFPDKPFTQKANNSKMLGGKGDVEGYVAVVRPGAVLFEISGVEEVTARRALKLGAAKLSVKSKIIASSEF